MVEKNIIKVTIISQKMVEDSAMLNVGAIFIQLFITERTASIAYRNRDNMKKIKSNVIQASTIPWCINVFSRKIRNIITPSPIATKTEMHIAITAGVLVNVLFINISPFRYLTLTPIIL